MGVAFSCIDTFTLIVIKSDFCDNKNQTSEYVGGTGGQHGLVSTLKKVPSKSFLSKRLSQDRGNVFKQIIILMMMVMMMSMTMMTMTMITMMMMMMMTMMEKEGSDLIQMRQDLRCRNYSFGRKLLD